MRLRAKPPSTLAVASGYIFLVVAFIEPISFFYSLGDELGDALSFLDAGILLPVWVAFLAVFVRTAFAIRAQKRSRGERGASVLVGFVLILIFYAVFAAFRFMLLG